MYRQSRFTLPAALVVLAVSLLPVSALAQQAAPGAKTFASNAASDTNYGSGKAKGAASQKKARVLRKLVKSYGQIPIAFEPNVGQTDSSVRFVAHAGGYTLYLQPQELMFPFTRPACGTWTRVMMFFACTW